MLEEICLRYQMASLIDFVGMTILCVLPLPDCFVNVQLPALFFALLKLCLPPTTFAISNAASSIKTTSAHFAAGTKKLPEKGIAALLRTCTSARLPRSFPILFRYGNSTCFEATIF